MSRISPQIYGSLSTIAAHALSQGLISEDTYCITVDPAASHDDLCLTRILLSIKRAIRRDPSAIESFMEVLNAIGPPVSFLVEDLSEYLLSRPWFIVVFFREENGCTIMMHYNDGLKLHVINLYNVYSIVKLKRKM